MSLFESNKSLLDVPEKFRESSKKEKPPTRKEGGGVFYGIEQYII